MQADVAGVAQARACSAAVIAEFGRVDSLVNAAGLTARGTLLDTTPELFDAHIAVNLEAPFFLMQAVVADLIARKAPGTALRTIEVSCSGGRTRLKLGAGWLDVPEPIAALLPDHLRDRSSMTTAADPASSWAVSPGSSPANTAATAGSSAFFTNLASRTRQPAGRLARSRPRSATRSARRGAGRLAGHSRLVRLRRSPACSHLERRDVAAGDGNPVAVCLPLASLLYRRRTTT